MSALLGDTVTQSKTEDDKSYPAEMFVANTSFHRHSPTKKLNEDSDDHAIGLKRPQHEQTTENEVISAGKIKENKARNKSSSVLEQGRKLATSFMTSFKGGNQGNSSALGDRNKTSPAHSHLTGQNVENTWTSSLSGKEPMENYNFVNANNTSGNKPNVQVSGKNHTKNFFSRKS